MLTSVLVFSELVGAILRTLAFWRTPGFVGGLEDRGLEFDHPINVAVHSRTRKFALAGDDSPPIDGPAQGVSWVEGPNSGRLN